VLWLNLGDSYNGSGGAGGDYGPGGLKEGQPRYPGRRVNGLKRKDLIGVPWRVAFALQEDGWYLRSEIIWHKPNPMPESVTDRPTRAHETIFLLTKRPVYYYDADAIAEPFTGNTRGKAAIFIPRRKGDGVPPGRGPQKRGGRTRSYDGPTRNRRDVWTVASSKFTGAHFATFPERLVEPMILAGSREGDIVLDPFSGAATTGVVALRHRRRYIGVELNDEYNAIGRDRLRSVQPRLFALDDWEIYEKNSEL